MTPRESRYLRELLRTGLLSEQETARLAQAHGEAVGGGSEYRPLWDLAVELGLVTATQSDRLRSRLADTATAPPQAGGDDPDSTQSLATPSAAGGRRLGNFELVSKLGQGGMGAVYKARQTGMDRLVALKVLPRSLAGNEEFISRFLREARAAGKLSHPNIVAGIDAGFADGYYYFAMEYVEGRTLGDRLAEEGPIPELELAEIGAQVARALEHAHAAGIVHRDVKPENVLITPGGQAKLCDLGLVRTADEDLRVTKAGVAVGTPYYISPEQIGGGEPDARADIYSLGCTLYHLAAGVPPFDGENSLQVMQMHINETAPRLCEVRKGASRALDAVVAGMMAKDPADRYQTAGAAADDLDKVASGGIPSVLTEAMAARRRERAERAGTTRAPRRDGASRPEAVEPSRGPDGAEAPTRTARRPAQRSRIRLLLTAGTLLVMVAVIALATVMARMRSADRQVLPGKALAGAPTSPDGPPPVELRAVLLQEGQPVKSMHVAGYRGCDTAWVEHLPGQKGAHRPGTQLVNIGRDNRLRGLIRFAVLQREGGPLPDDAEIAEARLHLCKTSPYVARMELHRIFSGWTPTEVTWDAAAAGRAWSSPGIDIEPAPCAAYDLLGAYSDQTASRQNRERMWQGPWWCEFDVTESLRAALAEKANHGWALLSRGSTAAPDAPMQNIMAFAGGFYPSPEQRPRLILKARFSPGTAPPEGGERTVLLQDGQPVAGRPYDGTRDTCLIAGERQPRGRTGEILLRHPTMRGLVRFAVFASEGGPVPDGAEIASARLGLFKAHAYPSVLSLHEALLDWDESAATAERTGRGASWSPAESSPGGRDCSERAVAACALSYDREQWASLDVTASLRDWASKRRPNFGWIVLDDSVDGVNHRTYLSREHAADVARRPKLEVVYRPGR